MKHKIKRKTESVGKINLLLPFGYTSVKSKEASDIAVKKFSFEQFDMQVMQVNNMADELSEVTEQIHAIFFHKFDNYQKIKILSNEVNDQSVLVSCINIDHLGSKLLVYIMTCMIEDSLLLMTCSCDATAVSNELIKSIFDIFQNWSIRKEK